MNVFNLHRQLGEAKIALNVMSAQKSDAERRAEEAETTLQTTIQSLGDMERALLLQRQHTELLQSALREEDERHDITALRGLELQSAMEREAQLVAENARLAANAEEASRRARECEGRLRFTRESAQREVDRLAMECSKVFILYRARGTHVETADSEVAAMQRRMAEVEARCEAERQARVRAEEQARSAEVDAQRSREAAMASEASAQMARKGEAAKEEELVAATVLIDALEGASGGNGTGRAMQARHLAELEELRGQYEGRIGSLRAELNVERERCGRIVAELREVEARQGAMAPPHIPDARREDEAQEPPSHPQKSSRRRRTGTAKLAARADVAARISHLRDALGSISMVTAEGA